MNANAATLTISEKNDQTRQAVLEVLVLLGGRIVTIDKATIYKIVAEEIARHSLTTFPISRRYVRKAIGWLYAHGKIRMRRYYDRDIAERRAYLMIA